MTNPPSLAIIICATEKFQYCLNPQARAVLQNVNLSGHQTGHLLLATCEKSVEGIKERYESLLPDWTIEILSMPVKESPKKDYTPNSLLLISQLYTAAFDRARALGVDHVWTLESDVIPEPNNLRCMRDMLAFDGGFYDVAFCPYVSSGGGGIMGGRGSHRNWILPNWGEDEIEMPVELVAEMKAHKKKQKKGPPDEAWVREWQRLVDSAKNFPPKGNVFVLNAKGWRQRGWLEWAYPALGRGSVVPSDWMPMGNNLLSKRALQFADFNAYTGRGTQDLFLSYRLQAHGMRFCVLPHSPSGHVVRKTNSDGGPFTLFTLNHEQDGDGVGHLRQREVPYYGAEPGETIPDIPEDWCI